LGYIDFIFNNFNSIKCLFLIIDALDSINMIVNANDGTIASDMSYDAWGRRRNPYDWTYTNITTSSITDRGFTMHEMLDNFDLINMNGRAYDPLLGQFLSPDPFVTNPENPQSYNRYAYCLNNPLKYTDPSGYWNQPMVIDRNNKLDGAWDRMLFLNYESGFNTDYSRQLEQQNSADRIMREFYYTQDLWKQKGNGLFDGGNVPMYGGNPQGKRPHYEGDDDPNLDNPLFQFRADLPRHRPKSQINGSEYVSRLFPYQETALWLAKKRCRYTGVEQGIMITNKGFLVLPTYNNDMPDNRGYYGHNTSFFSYFPTEWKNGKLYVNYNGEELNVLGLIHLHYFWEESSYSDGDRSTVAFGSIGNLPLFLYTPNNFQGIFRTGSESYYSFNNLNFDKIISGEQNLQNILTDYYKMIYKLKK
jgi:RHS repeat-associated protein